jgi:hypothetical protein
MEVRPPSPNGKTIMLLHGKNFNGAYWGETPLSYLARCEPRENVTTKRLMKIMHLSNFPTILLNTYNLEL